MKIAIVDKKKIRLQIQNDAIKIDTQSIPLRIIDMLVLNHSVELTSKDILKLTKNDISILFVSHQNDNLSLTVSANPKNGDTKLSQYNSLSYRLVIAKYYLRQKLVSHQEQLLSNGVKVDISTQLDQIDKAGSVEELMGIEGAFAREYFQLYFGLIDRKYHKSKRSKRPPQDPVNALMSYWYSLVYHIISVKLISYGFEPAIGYLHTPFRSHNALSSDILEIFRAPINQAVLALFANGVLEMGDFARRDGVYLRYEGRKKIWGELLSLVSVLKPRLDTEIANLKKMIQGNVDFMDTRGVS